MRICLLTPEFLPAWGGVGTYTYNLARGLRDRAEVHVLTATEPPGPEDSLDGVFVHSLPAARNESSGVSPLRFQVAVLRHLPRLVRSERIDVVHANHAYMSDLLVRHRHRAASMVTVHTTLDTQVGGTLRAGDGAPRQALEGNVVRWRFLLQRMERRYLRQTPSMIFVSRWVRDRTFGRYHVTPEHSVVIPNAVDFARFTPARAKRDGDSGPRTVLFAGRLLALKGIDTLLHAAARMNPDVRFLFAGPGEVAPWTALASELGLGPDRCQFLGRVPYSEMVQLYRSVDVVVLPSFSESCPLVALEAMACGTPFIAADSGGVSEIVRDGETGWLFPPGDAGALASRIETVLNDHNARERVRSKALAWVRANRSIERMAAQTCRFYGQILEGLAS